MARALRSPARAAAFALATLALALATLVACGGDAQPSPDEWAARACEMTDAYTDASAAAAASIPATVNRTLSDWEAYAAEVAPRLAAAAQTAQDDLRDIEPAAGAEAYQQALGEVMAALVEQQTDLVEVIARARSVSEVEAALIAASSAAFEAATGPLATAGSELPAPIHASLDARCDLFG